MFTPAVSVSPRSREPMPQWRRRASHAKRGRSRRSARASGLPTMDTRLGNRPEPFRQLVLRHPGGNAKRASGDSPVIGRATITPLMPPNTVVYSSTVIGITTMRRQPWQSNPNPGDRRARMAMAVPGNGPTAPGSGERAWPMGAGSAATARPRWRRRRAVLPRSSRPSAASTSRRPGRPSGTISIGGSRIS